MCKRLHVSVEIVRHKAAKMPVKKTAKKSRSPSKSKVLYCNTVVIISNIKCCGSLSQFLPCDTMRCTVFVIVILSVCLSVRPSVCHTRALCPHGLTYDHDFFTIW